MIGPAIASRTGLRRAAGAISGRGANPATADMQHGHGRVRRMSVLPGWCKDNAKGRTWWALVTYSRTKVHTGQVHAVSSREVTGACIGFTLHHSEICRVTMSAYTCVLAV